MGVYLGTFRGHVFYACSFACGPEYAGGGSTHAWCQVYLPGAGWVEFDPTNGIIGNRDLIRVAVARDPSQAVPLSGTYVGNSGDELGMKVEVSVKCESDPVAPENSIRAGFAR